MDKENIKKIIKEFLDKLTVAYSDIEVKEEEFGPVFVILSEDAPMLIGEGGAHLSALNFLIKRIVEIQSPGDYADFSVDVNYYQTKKNEEIRQKAKILGERVKSFRSNQEMEPMSPYERMIVHSIMASDPELETESVGFGKNRHIVIKLKDNS